VQGAGMLKVGTWTAKSVTSISGSHARMQHDVEMQSKFIKMLARGMGPTAEIAAR